jgi:hypothetical protein
MADLVSEAEVTAFWPGFDDVDSTAQTLLLAAASAAVRKFCGREFATPASGTELYDGDGSRFRRCRRCRSTARRSPITNWTQRGAC